MDGWFAEVVKGSTMFWLFGDLGWVLLGGC